MSNDLGKVRTDAGEQIVNLLVRHPDVTYQEIGDLFGKSKQVVHKIARRAGLKRDKKPRRYRSDITVRNVLQLYCRNLLIKDIAQTLDCNVITVRRRLRAAGITKSEGYSRSMKLDWRGSSKIRIAREARVMQEAVR